MKGVAGLVLGAASAAIVALGVACHGARDPSLTLRYQKHTDISNLWAQIRGWRHEAKMELDPAPQLLQTLRGKSVRDAARVCPDGHAVPDACSDICSLADAICDNAEAICGIADELGKNDDFAQQKCTSGKASCREAKQRCCGCSDSPPSSPGTGA